MVLNYLKDISTRKILKKNLSNVNHTASEKAIERIGIVFDESYFYEKEALVSELIQNGIKEENIKFIVFKDKIKKNEVFEYTVFSNKDLSWYGTLEKKEINEFVEEPF